MEMPAPEVGRKPFYEGQKATHCGCYFPVCQPVEHSSEKKKRFYSCLNCGKFEVPGNLVTKSVTFEVIPEEEVKKIIENPQDYMTVIKEGPVWEEKE